MIEEESVLAECFDKGRNKCVITLASRLRGALGEALDAFVAVLDGYTLADLVEHRNALRELLRESSWHERNVRPATGLLS